MTCKNPTFLRPANCLHLPLNSNTLPSPPDTPFSYKTPVKELTTSSFTRQRQTSPFTKNTPSFRKESKCCRLNFQGARTCLKNQREGRKIFVGCHLCDTRKKDKIITLNLLMVFTCNPTPPLRMVTDIGRWWYFSHGTCVILSPLSNM